MLLTQLLVLQPTISKAAVNEYTTPSIQSVAPPILGELTTDSPGGTEKVKTNVITYGGFEKVDPDGSPDAMYESGSGYIHLNHSYKDEVYAGSFGGYLSCRGTSQYPSYASDGRYMEYIITERPYLDQKITANIWYNAKANPDYTFGAEMYFRFYFSTNLGNYNLRYYLSRVSGLPTNQTTSKFIDVRGGLNSWTNIVRNVTYDFEEAFGGGPDLSLSYIYYTYFQAYSPKNPTGDLILLFDEISITNDTGFDYMHLNGDFEDGNSNYWSDYDSGPGSVYRTADDYTEDSYAMNMTATSPTTSSNGYAYAEREIYAGWGSIPKSYYAGQPGDLVFSFDWKYSDTLGLGSQYAYFIIYTRNTTFSSYIYIYLGDEDDTITNSNATYTTYCYYHLSAENMGIRDTWNTETIDYYSLMNSLNLSNQVPHYIGFNVNCNNVVNGKVQFLVDDLQITTYPAPDPSFEGNLYFDPSDPIEYWQTTSNDLYVNVTSDAYTGNWAANLSSYSGYTNVYCRKPTFLPISAANLYTDFYWRLDSMTDTGQLAYAEIRLEIDGSKIIHYVLGNNSLYNPTNSSNDCYYFVDGHNQIGTWNNLFRQLVGDVTNAFGPFNYDITEIDIMCMGQGSEVVKLIVDDMHFAQDIQGPIFNNLLQNPVDPEYGQAVDVSVDITDNILMSVVTFNYKIGSSSWGTAPLTIVGDTYAATIPGADYGETVSYYFEAMDVHYHITELGSEASPYTYVVDDFTDPVLILEVPPETQTLNGTILLNITDAYDLGSGIATFEIEINGTVVYNEITFPANYTWDTEVYENNDYLVIFRLVDNAGNTVEVSYSYNVYNPPTGWENFKAFMVKWGPYIGGGAGALLIGILVIVIVVRRKKRIA